MHVTGTVRIATLGLAAGLATVALAACSSSGSGAAHPSNPQRVSSSPSTVSSPTPTGSPSPTTTGVDASNPPVAGTDTSAYCAESQLRAAIDPRPVKGSSAVTGNANSDLAIIVDFTNTSSTACTIYGYPGAALVDSSGSQVQEAHRTIRGELLGLPVGQNTLPSTVLQPGQVASAGIEGTNQQEQGAAQAGCDATYPRILVTPPNTATPVPFNVTWPVCFGFNVHPANIEKNPPTS